MSALEEFLVKFYSEKKEFIPTNFTELLDRDNYYDCFKIAPYIDDSSELINDLLDIDNKSIPLDSILKRFANNYSIIYSDWPMSFSRYQTIYPRLVKEFITTIDGYFPMLKENNEFHCEILNSIDNKDKLSRVYSKYKNDFDYRAYYTSTCKPIFFFDENVHKFRHLDEKNIFIVGLAYDLLCEYERTKINHFTIDDSIDIFVNVYKGKSIDIEKALKSNYNLIEINADRALLKNDYPRILDNKAGISYGTSNYMDADLFNYLADLHLKYKFKISFLPDFLSIVNFINDWVLSLESVQFGKKFTIEDLKLGRKTIIKFIDDGGKDDALWIRSYDDNIIFEEIVNDFIHRDDNTVTTKMIHIQFENDTHVNIAHLDYELIFYTLEEYERRLENINQKGSAYKRLKIFKIDEARIPYEEFYDSLYRIAYLCFDNKTNVQEYFERL